MDRIPAKVFDEFAAEGTRMSAQHLRDLNTGSEQGLFKILR
jgi:hypothetical protein